MEGAGGAQSTVQHQGRVPDAGRVPLEGRGTTRETLLPGNRPSRVVDAVA